MNKQKILLALFALSATLTFADNPSPTLSDQNVAIMNQAATTAQDPNFKAQNQAILDQAAKISGVSNSVQSFNVTLNNNWSCDIDQIILGQVSLPTKINNVQVPQGTKIIGHNHGCEITWSTIQTQPEIRLPTNHTIGVQTNKSKMGQVVQVQLNK